jgi:hypothetical protein
LDKAQLKICVRLSGATRQQFEKHANALKTVLELVEALSIKQLGVRFGCMDAVEPAEAIRDTFFSSRSS